MITWAFIGILTLFAGGGDTRAVDEKEIKHFVERYVRERLASSHQEVWVEFRSMSGRVSGIPSEGVLHIAHNASTRLQGNVILPVEVLQDKRVAHTFLLSMRVRTFGPTVVARGKIEKGEMGESAPVGLEQRETTTFAPDVLTSAQQIAGKRAKQIIQRGAVLRQSMFEELPTVSQGNHVTLVVKTGAVTIRAKALAREDGVQGGRIRVQKIGSGDVFTARVVDGQTVEVVNQ